MICDVVWTYEGDIYFVFTCSLSNKNITNLCFYLILDPVSVAKTLTRYFSDDARILSFAKNVDCLIYSKSAGSRPDLWGAEVFKFFIIRIKEIKLLLNE